VRLSVIAGMYCLYGYPVILVDNIQDLRALLGPEKLQHKLSFGFRNQHTRYGQWKIFVLEFRITACQKKKTVCDFKITFKSVTMRD